MLINGDRALAYVTSIDEIRPIEGYDRVEHARVGGWWIIVSKADEFKPGDKCVYFEIDSQVPATEQFAFLEKRHYKIKTLKMCKVYSQGLIMSLSALGIPEDTECLTDLTNKLGVRYAEESDNERKGTSREDNLKRVKSQHSWFFRNPVVKKLIRYKWFQNVAFKVFKPKKKSAKSFPTGFPYVHKTDEERVENLPYILEDKSPLIVTEKLDGTSCTYILEKKKPRFGKVQYEYYVSSRNVRQLQPDQKCYHEKNVYWDLSFKYNIEEKLKQFLEQHPELSYVCIQGEGVGSVQGNPLKLKEDDLYVFNFITSDKGRWDSVSGREVIESFGMKWVPILDTNYILPDDMEEFKQFATAKSAVNPNVLREGIVLRNPATDFSFKNVSREYLMKLGK